MEESEMTEQLFGESEQQLWDEGRDSMLWLQEENEDDDFDGFMTPLISVQRNSIKEEDPDFTKEHMLKYGDPDFDFSKGFWHEQQKVIEAED